MVRLLVLPILEYHIFGDFARDLDGSADKFLCVFAQGKGDSTANGGLIRSASVCPYERTPLSAEQGRQLRKLQTGLQGQ